MYRERHDYDAGRCLITTSHARMWNEIKSKAFFSPLPCDMNWMCFCTTTIWDCAYINHGKISFIVHKR